MALLTPSSFPGGFGLHGVSIRGVPVLNTYGGNVYWVNSAIGGDGQKGTRERPFATLDYAIGRCTANNGDIIMVAPNHAETITGVGGITADVAGITIVGMGRYNQRPRFLMDGATTVTFVVSAADVTVMNCVFAGGHNGIARCFNITGAGFTAIGNEFEDNTTNEHFLIAFDFTSTTDNTADGATLVGNRWYTPDTGVTAFANTAADIARLTMLENLYIADGATAAQMLLVATGKSLQALEFGHNKIVCGNTAGDTLIDNDQTDNTGIAYNNYSGHHDTVGATPIDCDGIRVFENYSTAADTASGLLLPVADVDTN
jgi:hypothetical protein